ncbi:Global transcription regulator sge1 [Microbotryomycetes sp. JL221]|nr:Global transcription regulator sge1 [Microbotryomycetes sp. JL221]
MAELAFRGFVETTLDALLIFEGCRRSILPKITRRLQESEKKALVNSGSVFVFDEEETGIKRWTDGLIWSPSRTLGNFLLYRELDKKAGRPVTDSKSDSMATQSKETGDDLYGDNADDLAAPIASTSNITDSRRRSFSEASSSSQLDRARERALVGSLTSSTRFRADGLVKKTISLAGVHMICYYRIEDVTSGRLRTPSSHPELMSMEISQDMLAPSLFRVPPVIEIGIDGQVRYKSESDTPLSPTTRPGSSSAVDLIAPPLTAPQIRSRPPSSDSANGRTSSPRVAPIPLGLPRKQDAQSVSPSVHRASVGSLRSSGRFDPYTQTSRGAHATPTLTSSSYPATAEHTARAQGHSFTLPPQQETYDMLAGVQGASWQNGDGPFDASAPLNRPAMDPPMLYQPQPTRPMNPSGPYAQGVESYPAPPGSSGGIFSYQAPPPSRGGPTSSTAVFCSTIPVPASAGSILTPRSSLAHHHVSDVATNAAAISYGYRDQVGTAYTPVREHFVQPTHHHHPPATAPAQYHQRQSPMSAGSPWAQQFRPVSSHSLYDTGEYDSYDCSVPSTATPRAFPQAAPSHHAIQPYGNYISKPVPPPHHLPVSQPPPPQASTSYAQQCDLSAQGGTFAMRSHDPMQPTGLVAPIPQAVHHNFETDDSNSLGLDTRPTSMTPVARTYPNSVAYDHNGQMIDYAHHSTVASSAPGPAGSKVVAQPGPDVRYWWSQSRIGNGGITGGGNSSVEQHAPGDVWSQ